MMNLVLFEDAMRHVCRVSRIIESSGATLSQGRGRQAVACTPSHLCEWIPAFQVVITSRYGVNDLKADLQIMYKKAGMKERASLSAHRSTECAPCFPLHPKPLVLTLLTRMTSWDERFLVFMNDLLILQNILLFLLRTWTISSTTCDQRSNVRASRT